MESTLHWIYVGVMLLGALIFFLWSRNPKGVPQYEYLIAMFIPIWSGAAYMALALGQGKIEIDGQIIYVARYLDWIVTTPLLLLALSLTAMYKKPKDVTLIASLMGADVFMIVCGLIADLSETPIRYIWYGLGVAAFLVIMWLVWVTLNRRVMATQDNRMQQIYRTLAAYLTLFWIGYPLTWLIGPSGLGLVSQEVDTFLFVFLPMFSKVGFSLLDLSLLRSLNESEGRTQSQTQQPSFG
ncbi:MAG: bacteriorhodopsin [bacterium]|nr:bacteriorhodopsin [bacterium]